MSENRKREGRAGGEQIEVNRDHRPGKGCEWMRGVERGLPRKFPQAFFLSQSGKRICSSPNQPHLSNAPPLPALAQNSEHRLRSALPPSRGAPAPQDQTLPVSPAPERAGNCTHPGTGCYLPCLPSGHCQLCTWASWREPRVSCPPHWAKTPVWLRAHSQPPPAFAGCRLQARLPQAGQVGCCPCGRLSPAQPSPPQQRVGVPQPTHTQGSPGPAHTCPLTPPPNSPAPNALSQPPNPIKPLPVPQRPRPNAPPHFLAPPQPPAHGMAPPPAIAPPLTSGDASPPPGPRASDPLGLPGFARRLKAGPAEAAPRSGPRAAQPDPRSPGLAPARGPHPRRVPFKRGPPPLPTLTPPSSGQDGVTPRARGTGACAAPPFSCHSEAGSPRLMGSGVRRAGHDGIYSPTLPAPLGGVLLVHHGSCSSAPRDRQPCPCLPQVHDGS